jgi:hypothetical protein
MTTKRDPNISKVPATLVRGLLNSPDFIPYLNLHMRMR